MYKGAAARSFLHHRASHIPHFVMSQRAKVMENFCGTPWEELVLTHLFGKKMIDFLSGLTSVKDLVCNQAHRLNGQESLRLARLTVEYEQ